MTIFRAPFIATAGNFAGMLMFVCFAFFSRESTVTSCLFIALALFLFWIAVKQPLALEIYEQFFVIRRIFSSTTYQFKDVRYICKDRVLWGRVGTLPSVRIDLRSGNSIQLKPFENAHGNLYNKMIEQWNSNSNANI